jgi:WD40 repeat protein
MTKLLFLFIVVVVFEAIPLSLFSQNKSDLDTALLGAVKRNDPVVIKKLISKGANVNYRDGNNATILMWAADRNDLSLVKYLISKGADVNATGTFDTGSLIFNNALSVAVRNKNSDIVYLLLNKCKCSVSKKDISYIDKSNPGKRFDLSDFDPTNAEDGIVLSYLFLKGLEIRLFDLIPFEETEWAAKDYLKYYFDSLFITDDHSRTLLHAAAQYNRIDLAKYLIKNGVEIDASDESNTTAYYLASQEDNKDFMALLIDNGADTTIHPVIEEKPADLINEKEAEQNNKPVLGLPLGHTDKINSINYSKDGKLVVTSSNDNTAKIWEASSGKLLHSLEGHTAYVTYANFTPDLKYVITQSYDGTIKTWNTITGKLLYSFNCNPYIQPHICSDSRTIYIALSSYLLKYNLLSGNLATSKKLTGEIWSTSENNDRSYMFLALSDTTVKVLDVPSDKVIYSVKGPKPNRNIGIKVGFFSNSSRYLCVVIGDSNAEVLETNTGKILYTLGGHKSTIVKVIFSTDDRYIITKSYLEKNVKVWNAADGNLLFSIDVEGIFPDISFSPDGNYIYSTDEENNFNIWEVPSGKLKYSLKTELLNIQFLTQENRILLVSSDSIRTIDSASWKIIKTIPANSQMNYEIATGGIKNLVGHARKIVSADFSRGNDSLIVTSEQGIRIIDKQNGQIKKLIPSSKVEKTYMSTDKKYIALNKKWPSYFEVFDITSGKKTIDKWVLSDLTDVSFSPVENRIAVSSTDNSVTIWDCATGKIVKILTDLKGGVNNVAYSNDGKYLAGVSLEGNLKVWKTADYTVTLSLKGHNDVINSIDFSHNNKFVVTSSNDTTACVWDIQTGKLLSTLKAGHDWISNSVFSPDDKYIITSTSSTTRLSARGRVMRFADDESLGTLRVWDPFTGNQIAVLNGHSGGVEDFSFSPDKKYLITASIDRNAIIWDCSTWRMLYRLEGHSSRINSARFSSDSKYALTASDDSRVKIWDTSTGKEILTWIAVDSTDWVVVSPTGLFDATPGAMQLMYYVRGLDVIDLGQLKERYYEPNLWSKLMGFNPEPVRDVKGFEEIRLYPSALLKINNENLEYTLTDNGGGIGKYTIYINGKEAFSGNLPKDSLGFRGGKSLTSSFSLKNHPYLIPGQENEIMVKAYNGENYLVSRGESISYLPEGVSGSEKPRLFIISSGISDYTGDLIDLRYAAKDAEDMTQTLDLGANRLFGTESTYTYKLTTNNPDHTVWPTKINIEGAFNKVAREAKASDILIVYLSGHGINLGDQDGDFYYLTQDAYTANIDAYKDKAIRDKTTISSAEMTDLIKKVPALKQVLIIDACGSGKTVENLMAKREIASSTLRALDRMKDRTGLHIITGCAADAVSYEASRYGQGILTYSLLEGMKGASLRDDKFVDVVNLFQYGRERVPELAEGIGGIQQPQVFSPYGEASFDIGEIDTRDKALIPLAQAKPVIIMSSLKDKETFDDILGMEKLVDDKLMEMSSGNKDARFVFINARDFPEAYKIRGQYSVSGNNVEVTVNIFKGTTKTGTFLTKGVRSDLEKLSVEIVKNLSF